MKRNIKCLLILSVLFILGLYGYYVKQNTDTNYLGVDPDNELLLFFKETHPNNDVVLCGYEDLNDDGRKDLLVIYIEGYRKNAMIAVIDTGDGYKLSDHTHAPVENPKIVFKDIDKTGPIEFIVSGSKDGKHGYAIFRLIDDKEIRDLFGEGMEDCC